MADRAPETTATAALAAAADAASKARTRMSRYSGCNAAEGDRAVAEAAVLAFLRALNPAPEFRSNGGFYVRAGFDLVPTTLHDLTASVERAHVR